MTFRMTGIRQLLARHGRTVKLNFNNVGNEYNPETGEVETESRPSVYVRGYFYDSDKYPMVETQIGEGNRRLVLYPVDTSGQGYTKPQDGDSIEGQRDTVHILRVEEVMSNEQVLFYLCRVKE